ncbi:hypothetical protein [Deinococcus kurensis]|uniref:hypothetical protein n=1 Tax=Deinococcus kurensis TaxID=2662757 RepID=UPI0012D2C908|nr:hypothetical protein [Deinococcus kurensis]
MPDIDTLAKAAYTAYGESADGVSISGVILPSWEALPENIRAHWRRAVDRVAQLIRDAGEGIPA